MPAMSARFLSILIAVCLFAFSRCYAGVIIFDTITGNSFFSGNASPISGATVNAQQFETGDQDSRVTSIVLYIAGITNTSLGSSPWAKIELREQGTSEVSLAGGSTTTNWPGDSLFTIYDNPAPTSEALAQAEQLWAIDVSNSPLLFANTKYWISLSVEGEGEIVWNALSGSYNGLPAAAINDPFSNGQNVLYPTFPQGMQVTVNPVPESSPEGLLLVGGAAIAVMSMWKSLRCTDSSLQ